MMKRYAGVFLLLCLLFVSACGSPQEQTETSLPEQTTGGLTQDTSQEPDSSADISTETNVSEERSASEGADSSQGSEASEGSDESVLYLPGTREEISEIFLDAMTELRTEVRLNISGLTWEFGAENDLKNLYYAVLSEHTGLKYAYDMEVSLSGDTAVCSFLYMPYVTGAYESGVPEGAAVIDSLYHARAAAQGMTDGTERMTVAITDPALSVDDIQRALGQAGYGWIRYDLSRDGTELIAQPATGRTLEECAVAIEESFRLGSEIVSEQLDDSMTEGEQIEALYEYIVENVSYDFRYYSDWEAMPYESTVAIGALRDHLAICGGYAQAFQTLLDLIGVENYTVSGVSQGEYHMWNYVVVDGVGYYCDPTSDRGGMRNHYMLTVEELAADGGYSWDHEFLTRISGAADK